MIVHSIAVELGMSRADGDDLLQNTCLSALHGIDRLRDPSRLCSWVYSIAYRLAIDRLRKRTEASLEDLADNFPQPSLEDPAPSVTERLQRIEEATHLADAMAQIGQRCRTLLTALYFEDPPLGYTEVSERLRIPIGSIGPTRARCLKKLRDRLEDISKRPVHPSTLRTLGREGPGARAARKG